MMIIEAYRLGAIHGNSDYKGQYRNPLLEPLPNEDEEGCMRQLQKDSRGDQKMVEDDQQGSFDFDWNS